MCEICNGMTYREMWNRLRTQILDHGWCLQAVEGTDARNPPFAYTIGLSRLDHPEIITFGMCPECAHECIEPLATAVLAGRRLDEGDDVAELYRPRYPDMPPAELLRFPDSSTHLLRANDMYRGAGRPPIPALQIFWPSEIPLLSHPRVPDRPAP